MRKVRTWLRHHVVATDGVIAAIVFALGLLSVRIGHDIEAGTPHQFSFAAGVVCMALLGLPLILRRWLPPVALACVTLSVVGGTVFRVTDEGVVATVAFVAIYSAGAYCSSRVANWTRGICVAVMFGDLVWVLLFRELDLGHSQASAVGAGILSVGANAFFFVAAWAIGDVARAARHRAVELAERNAELEAAQKVIAEQAVLDERVRIAREVHDVVAHHVSMMGVQAGAARRVMARSPEQSAEVLSGIEASSRQAVVELHRLLGFLRQEEDASTPAAPRQVVAAPQPSLAGLDALVAQLHDAGLGVTVERIGPARPLSPSVDLSAYRIVQEALTNALKHAGSGTLATVTLDYGPDSLKVQVTDDGRGRANGRAGGPATAPAAAPGHGLIGMRERVALHGGVFTAERGRGSGFTVTAEFPLSTPYNGGT